MSGFKAESFASTAASSTESDSTEKGRVTHLCVSPSDAAGSLTTEVRSSPALSSNGTNFLEMRGVFSLKEIDS